MPRTLTLPRWEDFEAAFIIGSPDARYFVHLETGEVEYTSHMDDEKVRGRVLARTGGPGWLEVPRAGSDAAMAEIEEFIATEGDPVVAADLRASLKERIPFRAFMRALGTHPGSRQRWNDARRRGIHKRLLAFCRANDLVIDDDHFRGVVAELE